MSLSNCLAFGADNCRTLAYLASTACQFLALVFAYRVGVHARGLVGDVLNQNQQSHVVKPGGRFARGTTGGGPLAQRGFRPAHKPIDNQRGGANAVADPA